MPRAKVHATLSGLIDDSASEADLQMPTPDSANEKIAMSNKSRTKLVATKSATTKPSKTIAPIRRRQSVGKVLTTTARASKITKPSKVAPKKRGRPALSERLNVQNDGNETEEVDEFDQLENDLLDNTLMTEGDELNQVLAIKKKPSQAKNSTVSKSEAKLITKREKPTKAEQPSIKNKPSVSKNIQEDIPEKKTTRGRQMKSKVMKEPIIQETQLDPMELDELDESSVENLLAIDETSIAEESIQPELQEPSPQPQTKTNRPPRAEPQKRSLAQTRQISTATARTVAPSEDPNLRRKVGELTAKLEASDLRYQTLRDVGIIQAESKFDQLKKQTELSASTAKSLIQTLKATISTQDVQIKEFRALKKQFAVQAAELTLLQDEINKLNNALAEAQRTNKQLSATLAAKRVAASTVESVANSRVPGSAMKPGLVRMIGSQEAAEEAEKASLKEDVYGDLTGLLIRKVTRNADEDVFDCIQTGRNGSLHFHLSINNAESFDEAQCTYEPQLDQNRDRDLIDMLDAEADYLCDEISFPRAQAARFYGRMSRALTEKRE